MSTYDVIYLSSRTYESKSASRSKSASFSSLLVNYHEEFYQLFDAKQQQKFDLLSTYAEIDEELTEIFFSERDMNKFIVYWFALEASVKDKIEAAILETKDFQDFIN